MHSHERLLVNCCKFDANTLREIVAVGLFLHIQSFLLPTNLFVNSKPFCVVLTLQITSTAVNGPMPTYFH